MKKLSKMLPSGNDQPSSMPKTPAREESQFFPIVGVILSGMGSDGTLGLRAIKEKGGQR